MCGNEGGVGRLSVMWKWSGLRVKFIIITLISSQASVLATAKGNTEAYLSQFREKRKREMEDGNMIYDGNQCNHNTLGL